MSLTCLVVSRIVVITIVISIRAIVVSSIHVGNQVCDPPVTINCRFVPSSLNRAVMSCTITLRLRVDIFLPTTMILIVARTRSIYGVAFVVEGIIYPRQLIIGNVRAIRSTMTNPNTSSGAIVDPNPHLLTILEILTWMPSIELSLIEKHCSSMHRRVASHLKVDLSCGGYGQACKARDRVIFQDVVVVDHPYQENRFRQEGRVLCVRYGDRVSAFSRHPVSQGFRVRILARTKDHEGCRRRPGSVCGRSFRDTWGVVSMLRWVLSRKTVSVLV